MDREGRRRLRRIRRAEWVETGRVATSDRLKNRRGSLTRISPRSGRRWLYRHGVCSLEFHYQGLKTEQQRHTERKPIEEDAHTLESLL